MRFISFLFLFCFTGSLLSSSFALELSDQSLKPLLSKTSGEVLADLESAKKEKSDLLFLSAKEKFLESLKTPAFKRVDPADEKKITEVERFTSIDSKLGVKPTETNLPTAEEVHKRLFFSRLNPGQKLDLLLVDDFFPLMEKDFSLVLHGLSRLVYFASEDKDPEPLSEDKSFVASSFLAYPLGYKDFDAALAFAQDSFVICYNQEALRLYDRLIASEGKPASMPKNLQEMNFTQFAELMQAQGFNFYYPDPRSLDLETRKAGLAFLFQLFYWTDPQMYQTFLAKPKSPEVETVFLKLLGLLKKHTWLKPEATLDSLLQKAVHENIYAVLPQGFDPNVKEAKLPAEFKASEQGNRLSFAYLPESFYLKAWLKDANKVRNKDILGEIQKIKDEETRLKKEREKARKERGKRKKVEAESEEGENATTEAGKEQKEAPKEALVEAAPEEPKIYSREYQLSTAYIEKVLAYRMYLVLPQSVNKKLPALYLMNGMLWKDVQKALTMAPNYLRAVRTDFVMESYVPRLVSTNPKENKKENQWFAVKARIPTSDAKNHFLPMLNPFYQRALNQLLKRKI